MSQENVETVKAAMDAFNRQDSEAFAAAFAREAEIVPLRAAVEGTTYSGENAPHAFLAATDEVWREAKLTLADIRDLGETVLAPGSFRALGRESGVEVDTVVTVVMHFREGLAVRAQVFRDHTEALEAAGLSE